MTTLREIARETGLNVATVSLVLNQTTRPYSAATRKRVHETAQRLGFVPNNAGRRLARNRTNSQTKSFDQIGLIHLGPLATLDPACVAMMGGAEHELYGLRASLVLVRVVENGDWAKVERLARAGGVDGWLVVGQVDDVVVKQLQALGQPFVILGDSCCTGPVPRVDVDNFAAGYLAVQHLASLGHRRIAYFIANQPVLACQRLTLEGFRAGVKELGLEQDERLYGNNRAWPRCDLNAMFEWLGEFDPAPTALFAPELATVTEFQKLIQSPQAKPPQELSLLSIGIAPPMRIGEGVTRIELPIYEIGQQGAILLHRLASGADVDATELKIAPTLVDNGSTSPPIRREPGRG